MPLRVEKVLRGLARHLHVAGYLPGEWPSRLPGGVSQEHLSDRIIIVWRSIFNLVSYVLKGLKLMSVEGDAICQKPVWGEASWKGPKSPGRGIECSFRLASSPPHPRCTFAPSRLVPL